ncbi:MAG: 1-(5-phosphoribosyl)-5-[(5-phosphoribosylamino)methylideneamino] imidazole-4-carboxamide isomerase [Planctomycetota bacterium]
MIVYPAIDLLGGRVVRMRGGRLGTEWTVSEDPVGLAREWERRGAKALHVVDLDAALGRGQNQAIEYEIVRSAKVPVQLGGGLRETADIDLAMSMGAARVIVGTRGIEDPGWLRTQATRRPGKVLLAVDAQGTRIVVKGWTEETKLDVRHFATKVASYDLAGLLYTNVAVEGQAAGVDWVPIEAVLKGTRLPVIISGGVTRIDEIARLRDLGAHGVVLGTALYKGEIDFEAACRAAEGA